MHLESTSDMTSERLYWVDGARALAIILVIAVHTTAPLLGRLVSDTVVRWWAAVVIDTVAQVCVPFFVMISGIVLLAPENKADEPIGQFLKKRFLRVVLPFLVYSAIYFIWRSCYLGQRVTPATAAKDLYTGNVFFHFWYIYTLIGLYAVTPILRLWFKRAPYSHRLYYLIISLGVVGLVSGLSTHAGLSTGVKLVGFTAWSGFFVFGGVLGTRVERSIGAPRPLLACMALASAAFSIVGTYAATAASGGTKTDFRYFGALVPGGTLLALTAFLLVRHTLMSPRWSWGGPAGHAIRELSACSYGVYFLHPIVMTLLADGTFGFYLSGGSINPWLGIPATVLATVLICLAVLAAARRIPLVRRLLC